MMEVKASQYMIVQMELLSVYDLKVHFSRHPLLLPPDSIISLTDYYIIDFSPILLSAENSIMLLLEWKKVQIQIRSSLIWVRLIQIISSLIWVRMTQIRLLLIWMCSVYTGSSTPSLKVGSWSFECTIIFANLSHKLSERTFYKEISIRFRKKVQSQNLKSNRSAVIKGFPHSHQLALFLFSLQN